MFREYYPKNGRVILHVDMNSFYASVEMAHHPHLRGKPLAIAGNPKERKGIIVTCSYEARKLGIYATMPLWEAKRKCKDLIVRKPNFPIYKEASKAMFAILEQYSPLLEPVSIDEGYLDITDSYHLGTPIDIAKKIQMQILDELQLPCSIGVSPNKFLSKMASDMKKPNGITVLRKRDISSTLWPMNIIEMHGIGEKSAVKLREKAISTIYDLAHADDFLLKGILGTRGVKLKEYANGVDERAVDPEARHSHKSMGKSTTLAKDTVEQSELLIVLATLSGQVAKELKNKKYVAHTITVSIRYRNRQTITRSKTLANPIFHEADIQDTATRLFLDHWNGEGVRLLGVSSHQLQKKGQAIQQLDLFSYEAVAEKEPLYNLLDEVKKKFGDQSISMGMTDD